MMWVAYSMFHGEMMTSKTEDRRQKSEVRSMKNIVFTSDFGLPASGFRLLSFYFLS